MRRGQEGSCCCFRAVSGSGRLFLPDRAAGTGEKRYLVFGHTLLVRNNMKTHNHVV